MTRTLLVTIGAACLLVAVACGRTPPPPAPPATNYQLTPLKEVMQSMVAPNAAVLWNAVSFVSTTKGTEEKAPKTDAEWAAVDQAALTLLEATNLMQIPGRRAAEPGTKTANPDVNLTHDQIESLMVSERMAWVGFATAMHDAVATVRQAIKARNTQAVQDAGDGIDTACENCHLKFWYPPHAPAAAKP